jgi:hypothetical protein
MSEKMITTKYGLGVEQTPIISLNVEREFSILEEIGPFVLEGDLAETPALFRAVYFGHKKVLVEPRLMTLGGVYSAANLPANDIAGTVVIARLPEDCNAQDVVDEINETEDIGESCPEGTIFQELQFQYLNDSAFFAYLEAHIRAYKTLILGPNDLLTFQINPLVGVFNGSTNIYATLSCTGVEL